MRGLKLQKTGYRKNAAALLLTVAFLFGGLRPLSLPASAAESAVLPDILSEVLSDGLLACEEVIDLTAYNLPASRLGEVYASLLYDRPELFHVALRLSYTARDVTVRGQTVRMVAEVYPSYTLTGEALAAARLLYRDTVTAILAEMEEAFGERAPTEAEIVLWLHDCLADRYAYDTRPSGASGAPGNANAYALFRDGVGICQAYALAFMALARGAGLEADFVSSAAMDHAWNHVRVDGVWCHVDVTRDDPIPASPGSEEVNHTRLLRSDGGMEALGYHGYSCSAGHACTDTRFETVGEAALKEFHSALLPVGGSWLGETGDGAPAAAQVGAAGISVSLPGDVDSDGAVTPADLLAVYDPSCPEAWRTWVRERLVQ